MAGNSIGQLFRVTTFGESHGVALGCIVDGVPPGLELSEQDIQPDLDRRKPALHVTPRQDVKMTKCKFFLACLKAKPLARALE